MGVLIINKDLTTIKCDAIVNSLGIETDVHGVIFRSILKKTKSPELVDIVHNYKPANIGDVFLTKSYGLADIPNIVHVITPFYEHDKNFTAYENVLRKILLMCKDNGLKHIAFAPIGTGENKYPKEKVQEIMFNMFSSFTDLYPELDIDISIYTSDYLKSERKNCINLGRNRDEDYAKIEMEEFKSSYTSDTISIYDKDFFENEKPPKLIKLENYQNRKTILLDEKPRNYYEYLDAYLSKRYSNQLPIIKTAFSTFKLIISKTKESGDSILYSWKIKTNGQYRIPDKNTILKSTIALKMNIIEATNLLNYYGYTFSKYEGNLTDRLIEYSIINSIFDISKINNAFKKYGLKVFFG